MDPSRKRRLRLVVALTAAVLLATALIYTSFSASTEASKPSQLEPGKSYDVTGKVVKVNDALSDNPSVVNSDPYQEGWIVEVELSDTKQLDGLLDAGAYEKLLADQAH